MSRADRKEGVKLDESLRKKYIPMTETIYYTLLSVTVPRHGYAIMRHVNELTKGRLTLGTGTLYTMVGRLAQDGVIAALPGEEKKTYRITEAGMELLGEETKRLVKQLSDGIFVLGGVSHGQDMAGVQAWQSSEAPAAENPGWKG